MMMMMIILTEISQTKNEHKNNSTRLKQRETSVIEVLIYNKSVFSLTRNKNSELILIWSVLDTATSYNLDSVISSQVNW